MQTACIQGSRLCIKPLTSSEFSRKRPRSNQDNRAAIPIASPQRLKTINNSRKNSILNFETKLKNISSIANSMNSESMHKQLQSRTQNQSPNNHKQNNFKKSNLLLKSQKIRHQNRQKQHPLIRSFIIKQYSTQQNTSQQLYNCKQQHNKFVNNLNECLKKRSYHLQNFIGNRRKMHGNKSIKDKSTLNSFNNLKVKQGLQKMEQSSNKYVGQCRNKEKNNNESMNSLIKNNRLLLSPFTTEIVDCPQIQYYCQKQIEKQKQLQSNTICQNQQSLGQNKISKQKQLNQLFNKKLQKVIKNNLNKKNKKENKLSQSINLQQTKNIKSTNKMKEAIHTRTKQSKQKNNKINNIRQSIQSTTIANIQNYKKTGSINSSSSLHGNNQYYTQRIIHGKRKYKQQSDKILKYSFNQSPNLSQVRLESSLLNENIVTLQQFKIFTNINCQTPKKRRISLNRISPDRSRNSPLYSSLLADQLQMPRVNMQLNYTVVQNAQQDQEQQISDYLKTINF